MPANWRCAPVLAGCQAPEARQAVGPSPAKWNMPKGREGTLSNEGACDIAAYVLSHPRPDYADKAKDWPQGGKPADTPY